MRLHSVLVVALASLVMSGCSSQTVLMKTPAAAAPGLIDPFVHVRPDCKTKEVPVFVASARTVSGDTDPDRFYTDDRSRVVRLGRASVAIGADMSWEDLTRESRAEKRDENPVIEVTGYEEYGPLWSTAWPPDFRFDRDWDASDVDHEPAEWFVAAIETLLAASRRRQIMIYVHGFNTKFGENLETTSEFWHYMARDGVVISFDWASKGSMFSYEVDKANANFAIRQFRRLLEFLAEHTSAEEINILAHSAGNPVVVEALRELSLRYYDLDDDEARRRSKIGRLVLAAPDMDLGSALSASVDGLGRVTHGVAVYASRRDKALGFSGNIFHDVRVGRSIGKLSPEEQAALITNDSQWIDATAAQKHASSFIGHSYYHQNPWVSSDIMLYLRVGASAKERGLVRDMETGFLTFPEDYEQRLPEIVEQLRAKYDPQGERLGSGE